MQKLIAAFAKSEDGATAIEYGLIAALLAVVCIPIWQLIGINMTQVFNDIVNNLTN